MQGERAAVVLRVSSTGKQQQTESQDQPVYAMVTERGYTVAREFRIKKSAWHGKQQPVLDEVLAGIRSGEFTVVCVAALDRLERRGAMALNDWLRAVMLAGGRVESARSGEEWLADTKDDAIWLTRLAWEGDRARRESEIRSERTRQGHARKEREGQGWYSLPLGWTYLNRGKFDSAVVPDSAAQQLVRQAFTVVHEGGTVDQAAAIVGRTREQTYAILRNRVYSAGLLLVPDPIEVNQVVSPAVQERVISILDAHCRARIINREVPAVDYAGRIYCRRHLRPLHRTLGPEHKDGSRQRYYRAKTADYKSCGCPRFDADSVDELIELLMPMDEQPEYEMVVTGTDPQEAARIDAEISRLARKQPPGWYEQVGELKAAKDKIQTGQLHRERRETGRLMGDVWQTMDLPQKRRYLQRQAEQGTYRLLAWKMVTGQLRVTLRPFGAEHHNWHSAGYYVS